MISKGVTENVMLRARTESFEEAVANRGLILWTKLHLWAVITSPSLPLEPHDASGMKANLTKHKAGRSVCFVEHSVESCLLKH
jgi:hypothetical protein